MSISWLFVGEVKGRGVICFGLTEVEAEAIDDESVEADVNAMFSDVCPHGVIERLKHSMRTNPGADGLLVWDGIAPIIWRRATGAEVEAWGGYMRLWDEIEHILCGHTFPVVSISWLFVGEIKGRGVICFGLTKEEADAIDDDSVEADVNLMFNDSYPDGIIEVLKHSMRTNPGADGVPVWDGIAPITWRRATETEVEAWGGYQRMWDEIQHILCGYTFPVGRRRRSARRRRRAAIRELKGRALT